MKSLALRAAALLLAAVLGLVGWLGGLHASGNMHEVVAREYFRAGQLPPDRLRAEIARHGIRSIVNLRGSNMGRDWYLAEIAAAHDQGVTHLDFRMSASKPLTADRARELLALLHDAPKPVLVHCEGGVDRTGLATALYLAGEKGVDPARAGHALSVRYGHLGARWQRAWPMDESWARLAPVLAAPAQAASAVAAVAGGAAN